MSCMDHVCRNCAYEWFNNSVSRVCPQCGSINSLRCFDEPEDDYYDYYDDDEQIDRENSE